MRRGWRLSAGVAALLPVLWPLLAAGLGLLVGFHLFFPNAALTGWLHYQAQRQLPPGAALSLPHGELVFPLRLVFADVSLRNESAGWPELRCERLSLMPTLSTLVGSPGVRFSGDGPLGRFVGVAWQDGELSFALRDGVVAFPLPQQPGLRLDGRLNDVQLSGRLPFDAHSRLLFQADADNLVLHGVSRYGLAEDALALGRVQLQVEGAGRSLQLRRLQLAGGVLELEAGGELLLQPNWPASRIDLSLQLRPAVTADPTLRDLLALAGRPGADGAYRWQLRGPLSAPSLK